MKNRLVLAILAALLALGVVVGPPLVRHAKAAPPVAVGTLFNDLVSADVDLITDFTPPASHPTCLYRITIALVSTASTLYVVTENGGVTVPGDLNGSTDLTVGNEYTFTFGAARESTAGESLTYNLRMETATTIGKLVVDRVEDGTGF